jgi:hypothetical protein
MITNSDSESREEAEARAEAHRLLGLAWQHDGEHEHPMVAQEEQCDRITEALASHAAEVARLTKERDEARALNVRPEVAAFALLMEEKTKADLDAARGELAKHVCVNSADDIAEARAAGRREAFEEAVASLGAMKLEAFALWLKMNSIVGPPTAPTPPPTPSEGEGRDTCPLCKGTGKRETPSFADPSKSIARNCRLCKGTGSTPATSESLVAKVGPLPTGQLAGAAPTPTEAPRETAKPWPCVVKLPHQGACGVCGGCKKANSVPTEAPRIPPRAETKGRFTLAWTEMHIESGWTLTVVNDCGEELARLWINDDELPDLAALVATAAPVLPSGDDAPSLGTPSTVKGVSNLGENSDDGELIKAMVDKWFNPDADSDNPDEDFDIRMRGVLNVVRRREGKR